MIVTEEKIQKIQIALDEIRPFLLDDGGNISFVELTSNGVVKVRMEGACNSCDMITTTLKGGVEATIKRHCPDIKEVIAIQPEHSH